MKAPNEIVLTLDKRVVELQMLITKREGMTAENQRRKFMGVSPVHNEQDFQSLNVAFRKLLGEDSKAFYQCRCGFLVEEKDFIPSEACPRCGDGYDTFVRIPKR